jgi:hypothetical protein
MKEHSNNSPSEMQNRTSPELASTKIHSSAPPEVQPARPPKEQRDYWKQDLFYKKLSLFISGGGFLLIVIGLVFNIAQSHRVERSIRANVQNSVLNHVLTLDKLFMENHI